MKHNNSISAIHVKSSIYMYMYNNLVYNGSNTYYPLFLSLSLKVISRIFYTVDRTWKGRITLCDIHNSNFLQTLARLETENDINKISDYFSYEHFYVIYCKFWELDSDHDLLISAEDLVRHNDHGI